jgi:hypothetical protein
MASGTLDATTCWTQLNPSGADAHMAVYAAAADDLPA